jgi:DUF4097 and DUF4098 domain-containing protein YvlB
MELLGRAFRNAHQVSLWSFQREIRAMTIHKPSVVFLLLFTGVISAALSGCKYSAASSSQGPDARTSSGAVDIHKMGGEIDVEDAPHGATLATMGGDIHLGSVASFANLNTMGGNIRIDSADAPVDAKTMGGNITIARADGPIQATTMGGEVTARMVGSSSVRRDVHLSSMGGTITLTVPKDFPMDVRITLVYTKNATRSFHIIDDFDLSQRGSDDWDYSNGTPRKYIRAEGRVGSGLNHVEIKTINGDVILRRE